MKRLGHVAGILMVAVLGFAILKNPALSKAGAINGLLLCGRVIIPSLFPFTVCVLFLHNGGLLQVLNKISPVTKKTFGISGGGFGIWLLSLVGGYPIGAKLLNEGVKRGEVPPKNAGIMIGYCINAGPAFIVVAVGSGILNSKRVGMILLVAHILASLAVMVLSRVFFGRVEFNPTKRKIPNFADNFVLSTADSATALTGICAFVILFSAITEILKRFERLKDLIFLLEVTNGVGNTKNVYLISFLLGFAGFSIWCQVLSVAKDIKINFSYFVLCRILNGALNTVITVLAFKIFKVSLSTFSFGGMSGKLFITTPQIAFCLVITVTVFIISVSCKNFAGKLREDIV